MAHLGPHFYSESDPDVVHEAATEIFEIEDFTSPTDWERFVAQVEHLIREWGLSNDRAGASPEEVSKWPWRRQAATLVFYDFEFLVTWHFRENPTKVSPSRSESSPDFQSSDAGPKKSEATLGFLLAPWKKSKRKKSPKLRKIKLNLT